MSLEDYHRKRDFSRTPEPGGGRIDENQQRFVIQRHEARRLHYDLRLEMDGVLKSWAVPKGPSMNPGDKRLAVHTEDHPIEYLHFQGTIPKGNYGAGQMTIWDQGTYVQAGEMENGDQLQAAYDKGKLSIDFMGTKLRGRFALFRSHIRTEDKDHWLLIKSQDDFATSLAYDAEQYAGQVIEDRSGKKQPSSPSFELKKMIQPMLATVADQPFDDPEWIFELKYDGYRILSNIRGTEVEMYSRNGISYTDRFVLVRDELSQLGHEAILDGEMTVVDHKGHPQFQALQNYEPGSAGTLQYFVFDLLYLNGHALWDLPLLDRKELLQELLPVMKHVKYCDHISEKGQSFYVEAVDMGLEGIIAKKADSHYHPGQRSDEWRKIKKTHSIEAVICGYTQSDKSGRPFGSFILGMSENGRWIYIGNCGTGFTTHQMKNLFDLFQLVRRKDSPFDYSINLKGRVPQWLDPVYVCEVTYSEQTAQGLLRHPVFRRMRQDKNVAEVIRQPPQGTSQADTEGGQTLEVGGFRVSISNPEKVYWPESGLRKYDLLDYYITMAEWILPYLIDRPQNMHRHPDGIGKPGFYHKDQEYLPDWISTVEIESASSDKIIRYLLCQNEAALIYMVNLGCIEINPWMSRIGQLDHPDYTVIDLDPSPTNTFGEVRETALAVKAVLDRAGIKGYAKTSGSSGIHIYIPLGGEYDYDTSRDFTRLLCYFVKELLPDLVTMERSIDKRGGKIYLDYLQNRRGQTIVAPYSIRPVANALVSAPVTWKEIENGMSLVDFNIHTLPGRVTETGDLFSGLLTERLEMSSAIERLEGS